ncbi:hypothetical protein LJR290_006156 [Variovorax sp. LjRoot290]|uniref:hypothetical protein n=1 Tax=Variovorax sp. LjRoot290 TaxID=3342316 RepID=UPI003ECFFC48
MNPWFESLPSGHRWSSLWYGLVLCGCGAIRKPEVCKVCNGKISSEPVVIEVAPGRFERILPAMMGAEGRYEDYLYLELIEREWKRPVASSAAGLLQNTSISERASVVMLFWTYFEGRIERLVRLGLATVPEALREDVLAKYASVGSRMDRLYKLIFGTTYFNDLRAVGCANMVDFLGEVQARRNEFTHGKPSAINDLLAAQVVRQLRDEHFAWIEVFNHRVKALG